MVRSFAFVLFAACLLIQASRPAQAQEPAAQAPAATQKASSDAASAAQSGFPFDDFKDFSATMEGSVMVGDEREGHVYRSGDKLRMEGAEGMGYFIADLKEFKSYGLSPMWCMKDSHMYFRAFPFSANKPGRKIERTAAGTETIDGHACKIEDVRISGKDLPKVMKLRFWEAEDLQGFPIKVQVETGQTHATIKYKNVVIGPQDQTLFIRPRTCTGSLPDEKTAVRSAAPAPNTKKPQTAPKPDAPK